MYANSEAELHYRAALRLADSEVERADLLFGLGQALSRQDRFEDALQTWREAIRLYQSLGDYAGVARMYTYSARAAGGGGASGDAPRGLALCREGLAVMAGQPESSTLAALLHETGRACFFNGLLAEARACCEQALAMAERVDDRETQAETLATLWGLLINDQPEEAVAGLQRAAELAEAVGRLETARRAHHNLGFLLGFTIGDMPAGRDHILHAAELSRQMGSATGQAYSLHGAFILSFVSGDLSAAEETLVAMHELLGAISQPEPWTSEHQAFEAHLVFCRGEVVEASQRLQSVRPILRQHSDQDTLGNINCLLADALLELGDLAGAEEALTEAMAIADQGLMGLTESYSLMSTVRAGQGRLDEAHRLLTIVQEDAGPRPGAIDREMIVHAEARLARAEADWPRALTAYETLAALRAQSGVRWYRARTLCEWAEAHLARRTDPGDTARARELWQAALAEFEAMGAPGYVRRVQERLRELS
jgi:tetratricopeptide (TPR) repeat protein